VVALDLALVGDTLYMGAAVQASNGGPLQGSISQVSSGGGSVRTLATPGYLFGSVASDGARLYYPQIALDHAYLAAGLGSLDLATGATDSVTPSELPLFVGYDPSQVWAMLVAATPTRPGMFWIGAGPAPEPMSLLAWDSQSGRIAPVATGQGLSGLSVDGTSVYWVDAESFQTSVYSAPLAGGPSAVLATVDSSVARPTEPSSTPSGGLLGVSRDDVLFASDFSSGFIEAVSKAGGPVRELLTTGFAYTWVDSDDLYWTESSDLGALKRMPVAGGPIEVVWAQPFPVLSVAFGACDLYIGLGTSGQVVSVPR
jgi:hypothetical protein